MSKFTVLALILLISVFCVSGAEQQVVSSTFTPKASKKVQEKVDSIENTIGLIVLNKNYSKGEFIHIYNEDGSLWHRFTYYYDDSDGKFEYAKDDFRPFAFHPDYFLLALKCVRKERGRYEVIVNEGMRLKKYVKADDSVLRFETWKDHILKAFAVKFLQNENPLLNVPLGRVKKISLPNTSFHPFQVKGEWLKVRWNITSRAKDKGKYDSGWIRWKKGERLLVELFYFS